MSEDFLDACRGESSRPGPASRVELALRTLDDETRKQAVIALYDASGMYPARKVAAALSKRSGYDITDYMIRRIRRGDQELPDDL